MSERNSRVAINGRYRILFVDDDRELRDLLIAAVDPTCFHVDVVEGIDVAKHLAELEPWDIVICGARETLAEIHAFGLDRRIRALALSPTAAHDPAVRARPKDAVELRALLLDLAFHAHAETHDSAW
jgi:DNA-binding NtrC family response regulator